MFGIAVGRAKAQGLGINGQLLIVAATPDTFSVSPFALIGKRTSIKGWPSGTAKDSEATLNFSALADIRPKTEQYPLEKANEAYERVIANEARFRVVLKMKGVRKAEGQALIPSRLVRSQPEH